MGEKTVPSQNIASLSKYYAITKAARGQTIPLKWNGVVVVVVASKLLTSNAL